MVVAVLVAALGSALVFLYTKGADTRAEEKFDTVEVLKATAIIDPGETIEDAQAGGKLALQAVSQDSLLDGYQTTTDSLDGHGRARHHLPRRADHRGEVGHLRGGAVLAPDPRRRAWPPRST